MRNLFILFLLFTSILLSQEVITVPVGTAPAIDGNLSTSEWKDALKLDIKGGEGIYLKKDAENLYVAVKGKKGGFSTLGLGNENSFRLLHSSTGLITAAYHKKNGKWHLTYDFKNAQKDGRDYKRGKIRLTEEYRNDKLKQFGWTSNLVDMGNNSETEYVIPLSQFKENELKFSAVFFQFRATPKKAVSPENLNDGMLNQALIAGEAKNGLQFELSKWHTIKIK